MNKTTFAFVFFIFSFLTFSQNQTISNSNKKRIENLASLAKVWGFLKYYHPAVSKGKFDWDQQLLQIVPKVEEAQNKEQLSQIYLDWIADLGTVMECKSCKNIAKEDYFDKNFDLSWTQNANLFTNELSEKLKFIEKNRFQGTNYYAAATSHGNIEIRNETEYPDFEYPDRNHRLLSLFRYWNTIEYFFPYKYMTDQKWDAVLLEMIPRFESSQSAMEYQLAMRETVVKVDDTHAIFYTDKIYDFFGRMYIPAFVNVVEDKIVITGFYDASLAQLNDLKKGDIIEEIDGKNALKIMAENAKFVHGSNKNVKAKNYDYHLFNGSTDSVKLKIRRDNTVFTKNIKRYKGIDFMPNITYNKEKFNVDENNIAYINLDNLEMKDQDIIMDKVNSTKGLIIDLRNYPDFQAYLIARRLIKEDKEFVKLIQPDMSYPGRFVWKKTKILDPKKNQYYAGKVVLLVNEQTQSMAEYSAMFLQTGDNVIKMGSQTAGADGDMSIIKFLTFKTGISGLGVFYPDGTETQRVGVKVDVEVRPTIKGIQEGRDEVLEAAKAYLNNIKI